MGHNIVTGQLVLVKQLVNAATVSFGSVLDDIALALRNPDTFALWLVIHAALLLLSC